MPKKTTYTINQYVPDGKGGYRDLKDLSKEEYDRFREENTKCMGEILIECFRKRPEFFIECCKKGYITGLKRR